MTPTERIAALGRFGYDAGEARFLCLAALHSGYFLRRQYLALIQGTKGWKDVVLLEKLQANRHGTATAYRHNRMVYHLSAKPLYDAMGEKDNRNRRERQPSTIKNKLMGLDFVLQHPERVYLATEREKLNYFLETLKLPMENLPTRWYPSPRGRGMTPKHFVDKFPLFLAPTDAFAASVAHFCFVDEGLQSTDAFATYLNQYSRLLAALPDFRVIYVARHGGLLSSARRVFERFSALSPSPGRPIDPDTMELMEYFEARRQHEARDFARLDTAAIIRYRDDKKRFAGERYEALYRKWEQAGSSAVLAGLQPAGKADGIPIDRFSTCILEHDYDLFGTLTSAPRAYADGRDAQTQQ